MWHYQRLEGAKVTRIASESETTSGFVVVLVSTTV
jgi:hypothetical protein